ncbi:MAG TPA: GlsB/YeaQ/YmgE family stress response membrane protein [Paracoccaceae bacterium]|nr:GlsB/YeaQ/YmgE family stress response membrane protein [Paracoccaceae bacterium]
MSVVLLIIIGTAAGFIATRLLGLELGVPQTIAVGILGALIGRWVLSFLLAAMGAMAGLIGAILGAIILILIYQKITEKR